MKTLWLTQIAAVLRLEMRKTFFSRRGFWVYLLALLPLVIFAGHSFVMLLNAPCRATSAQRYQYLCRRLSAPDLRLVMFLRLPGIFMNLFRGEMLDRSLHFTFSRPSAAKCRWRANISPAHRGPGHLHQQHRLQWIAMYCPLPADRWSARTCAMATAGPTCRLRRGHRPGLHRLRQRVSADGRALPQSDLPGGRDADLGIASTLSCRRCCRNSA